jgi:hypothetical protein
VRDLLFARSGKPSTIRDARRSHAITGNKQIPRSARDDNFVVRSPFTNANRLHNVLHRYGKPQALVYN